MSQTIEHYTAYQPRPFTVEERKDVTLLFGGLTWKHERLMQGALENMGYHAMPLPNIARDDLDAGKELIDTGACCPTIFTTGSLARFLKERRQIEGAEAVMKKYVFITAGSCGPCRFGQYHESYTMALDGLGLRDFRMFLLDQSPTAQGQARGGGLDINLPFSLGTVWAILCGDLLTDLEYRTRPYEVVPGTTDAVLKDCVEILYDAFRQRPRRGEKAGTVAWHLLTPYFTKVLRKVFAKWDAIEVDRLRAKPRVKITGEFWLQTHEGEGNYDIKRWLEREGAEVIPPPVAVWLDYLNAMEITKQQDRAAAGDRGARRKLRVLKFAARVFRWNYDRLRRALGGVPGSLPDQDELKSLAAPFYSHRLDGGEGHMLVGKALYAHLHKQAHMTCELSPYSCMPNTMSVGAMSNVLGQHPDLLYAPIEVKGDAEVHALSRAQMVLTEAKKRAAREFDDTLATAGLGLEDARRLAAGDERLRRAGYALPHHGVAGTAANAVLDLVARRH